MRKIRVAHVITRLCKGGAQENTFHSVRLANRDRFEVDLISGPTEGPEGSIEEMVGNSGIAIIRVPELLRDVAPVRDFRALRQLAGLFRKGRYDIVHTHTSKAGFLGRWAARRAGVPAVVHTPHGNVFQGYFSSLTTRVFIEMERMAARWTDRIIELTPGGIEEHLALGIGRREQFLTVFSGIDLAPFEKAILSRSKTRQELCIAEDELLVGAVGRLEPVKGFTYLIDSAFRISERIPNVRFVLAGDGALSDELRRQAAPLEDRFKFLGLRHDVAELMAAMDVFVLTSINEGMGRVLLEAGAAGTPAVATRVGGVPDIIRDGVTGILVPPREPEAIAEAVLALARDPVRRAAMGKAAREVVVPAFGLEQMVGRIEGLYEELIREKRLDG